MIMVISVAILAQEAFESQARMTAEEPPHVALLKFSAPGSAFTDHEQREATRHAEVLREFLKVRASKWVTAHQDEPILEVYQSDGTPHRTTQREATVWENYVVRRAGKSTSEYLTERLWLHSGDGDTCVLSGYPVHMGDKTTDTSFNAWLKHWDGARRLGAQSGVHSHFCFDGAVTWIDPRG